jgi:hypothetical protein
VVRIHVSDGRNEDARRLDDEAALGTEDDVVRFQPSLGHGEHTWDWDPLTANAADQAELPRAHHRLASQSTRIGM